MLHDPSFSNTLTLVRLFDKNNEATPKKMHPQLDVLKAHNKNRVSTLV